MVRSFATAAQLELSAAGIKAPAQSQSLLGGQLNSPVFQTIKQHEAQAAAPAPAGLSQMTDSASRDDLNSYFDSFKAPNSPKLAAVQPSAPPAVTGHTSDCAMTSSHCCRSRSRSLVSSCRGDASAVGGRLSAH